jgi:asparagine synthase (glutamine-hydrolysing)
MPGVSLLKGKFGETESENGIATKNYEIILDALKSGIRYENYTQEILLKENSLLVAYTGYKGYPITIFEDDYFWICIEGKIYGKNSNVLREELGILLNEILVNRELVAGKKDSVIDKWLVATDGEFIIYAVNKKNNDFIVLNDALGRLPLYYYHDPEESKIIISREMQIITSLIWEADDYNNKDDEKFDKVAIAEYLLFGFTLGNRTLVRSVYRLKPATLIYSNNAKIRISNLYSFNFDNKRLANEDLESNVGRLVSLFSEACKNRADPNGNNIISLSGGFDSRCVAACLRENKVPFSAITYIQPGWTPTMGTSSEVEVAEHLANKFGCGIKNYGLVEPKARDLIMLIKMKFGANYLEFGYMMPILENLKNLFHGSGVVFFTGDGGDRLLPALKPYKNFENLSDLAESIMDRFGSIFFSKNEVAAMTQITERQIVEELKRILTSYPENSLDQKFVHFFLYEAIFNDLFESEDRNRAYFWSVSPYYSIPFFDCAMSCSDNSKSYARLQKRFILKISPLAAAIEKAEYDCSILSKRFKLIEFIISLEQRYPRLRYIIEKIRPNKGHRDNSRTIECLKDQILSCKSIGCYFVLDILDHILNNPEKYTPSGISVLFTITSLVETLFCSERSIRKNF